MAFGRGMKRTFILALAILMAGLSAACGATGAQDSLQQEPGAKRSESPGATARSASPIGRNALAPEDCDTTLQGTTERIDDLVVLAWGSDQVIVGEVVEQLPSTWSTVDSQTPLSHSIATDYVVHVDQRVRGRPFDMLRLRHAGGTVKGCTLTNLSDPKPVVGGRLLLFLSHQINGAPAPTYFVTGNWQGFWTVDNNGNVANPVAHFNALDGKPLENVVKKVRQSLLTAPPAAPYLQDHLVPLDRAPISGASTPAP